VDLSSLTPGREVTRGVVYRRIPNREGYFDHDEGLPDLAAFVPRPQDNQALSAHLDKEEAEAALASPALAGFGLCELDIGAMKDATAGRVTVEFFPTPNGRSHVRIHGCTDDEVRAILIALANVIREPDK
jgi:hypothetical protein